MGELKIYKYGEELRRYKIKEIRENCEEIKKNEGEDKDEKNGKCEIEKIEKTVRIEGCGWATPPYQPLTSFSLSLFFCQGS